MSVISLTPYKEQPVPEVGKEYHIFDDGKVKPSRHYIAKITELISFDDIQEQPDLYAEWQSEVKNCYWLYAKATDYFVKAESNFDENALYFVRTTDGGWFSIDYPNFWMSARLDIDGTIYEEMMQIYGCNLTQ